MPKSSAQPPHQELPGIDLGTLERVTGGAGVDMSMLLPIMMMKGKSAPAAPPPPPPAPPQPKILLNGVEQSPSALGGNGSSFETTV